MLASIQAQGQVFEVKRIGVSTPQPSRHGGGIRGKITEFSRAARRRLIDLTLRLDTTGVRCTFLTLTFTGLPSWEDARKAFRRLEMRFRRAYPEMSAIWRQEKQDRGAVHFHLILFRLPYIAQKELQKMWEECTGEEKSIVHIKLLDSRRAVFNYVSKYVAKREDASGSTSLDEPTYLHAGTGRHWGYINREALPMAEKWVYHVADDDALRYAMWGCYALSGGRSGRSPQHVKLFCQDALDMLKHALSICALQGWRVIEDHRRRLYWRNIQTMPFVRSYSYVWKAGQRQVT